MKCTRFFVLSLVLLFAAVSAHAQFGGFTGPSAFTMPQGFTGQQTGLEWSRGFTGQFAPIPVSQVYSYPNKAQAVLRGNIVSFLGGDLYLFRDSTGDIVVKIKHDRWWGVSVGPNDLVELGGELKRDKRTLTINHFDAKVIRRAL